VIAIIDYDAGNTCSVMNAMKRLNVDYILTDKAEDILAADKVIFPGVGHATQAMDALRNKELVQVIKSVTKPLLGICIGMQLLCEHSEEGETRCLGVFKSTVKKFKPATSDVYQKVPHMGWNKISQYKGELFNGLNNSAYVYFVHSYFVEQSEYTIATSQYNHEYSAALKKDNYYGLQFHVEKSSQVGNKILKNFLELS